MACIVERMPRVPWRPEETLVLARQTTTELAKKAKLSLSVISGIIHNIGKARLETTEIVEQQPIYNVWNFSVCDPRFGQDHPGRPAPSESLSKTAEMPKMINPTPCRYRKRQFCRNL